MDIKTIENISVKTEQSILRKSAYGMPDRPSESGMRTDEIKKAFYSAIIDKADSVLSELKRVVSEANTIITELYNTLGIQDKSKLNVSQGENNKNKTMVTDENGNVVSSDVVFVGGSIIQSGKENGEYYIEFRFPEEG